MDPEVYDHNNRKYTVTAIGDENDRPDSGKYIKALTSITIPETVIRQLKAEKEREAFRLGKAWKGDEWLFTQWDGSIMYPQTPSQGLKDEYAF